MHPSPVEPPFDFAQSIQNANESRKRVFAHDRSKTLGASENFGCLRRAWYTRFTPNAADDRKASGAAARGVVIEDMFMVPVLREIFGEDNALFLGESQQVLTSGLLSATPDGLLFTDRRDILSKYGVPDIESNCFVVEIKSFDPRMNLHEEKTVHRGQAVIQLGLFSETTKYRPKHAVVIYINAADFYDIRPFVVSYNETMYAYAKARAELLYKTTDPYALKAEGVHTGACSYCPFAGTCRDSELSMYPNERKRPLTTVETDRLLSFVAKHEAASAEAKSSNETKSRMNEDIKRLLNAAGTQQADIPGFKLSYSRVGGRKSLDTAALEAAGVNLEEYQKTGGDYTRLLITTQ